ncbi:hypothetical protein NDU88_004581 [Pleurodeles waltl]|uniref:Uncharacterized protein n=1 Tax=Pleurodeles waltl TaxID=8319 RepID=A0AAV7TRX4_PLEWA|nr:hypothetical protein NDU88_004581 [Pleurodeles waltl]
MIPRSSVPRRKTELGGEERERRKMAAAAGAARGDRTAAGPPLETPQIIGGSRAQKAELGGHPPKGPNRENRSGQGGPEATRDPLSRPWPLVAVTRGEALTNRAARAVVGTQSQHPDKRARLSSDQTQDPNGEDTALKSRNSLHLKDKRDTTETPPPKIKSYKPTHDRESTEDPEKTNSTETLHQIAGNW